MTLRDMIDQLEELADEHGDDIEVRLAHQPSWPFEYSIGEVAVSGDGDDDEDEDDEDGDDEPEPVEPIVYIGEGSQLGYLSGAAAKALGWSRR